jgi:hypothetical protein
LQMEILLRKDAIASGVSKYFTGKPCGKGHVAPRYTKTGVCCRCNVESARAYNQRIDIKSAVKQGSLLVYKLANDADFDAAWAYLQALDLARGATPQPNPRAFAPLTTAAPSGSEMAAMRAKAFGIPLDQAALTAGPSTMEWK